MVERQKDDLQETEIALPDPNSPTEMVKREYGRFDFAYPPFIRPRISVETPEYPEADERHFVTAAYRVFSPRSYNGLTCVDQVNGISVEELEHDLSKLGEDAATSVAAALYSKQRLMEAFGEARINIAQIKKYHYAYPGSVGIDDYIQSLRHKIAEDPALAVHIPIKSDKDLMRDHLRLKREIFERASNFLAAYLGSPIASSLDEERREQVYDLADEVQCIQLAYTAFVIARSPSHHIEPRRKSGELTIKHAFAVMIEIFNTYMELIEKTEDHEEKRELYRKMKTAILWATLHDYVEDYEPLDLEFLEDKLTELLHFDSYNALETGMSLTKPPNIPVNFWESRHLNRHNVLEGIWALTKPDKEIRMERIEETGQMEPHIEDRIIKLDPELQVDVFLVKLADRRHNLWTLESMSVAGQSKKVCQTEELIGLGIRVFIENPNPEIQKEPAFKLIPAKLLSLAEKALTEGERILSTDFGTPRQKNAKADTRHHLYILQDHIQQLREIVTATDQNLHVESTIIQPS